MKTVTFISSLTASATIAMAAPQYEIKDLGVVAGDLISQGMRISAAGVATGRSISGSGSARAFRWTQAGGITGLPNLATPTRNYGVGNGANDSGTVVGTAGTTLSGSSPLAVMWKNGTVTQLGLPVGQTVSRANAVNNSDVVVGSMGGGSSERAAIWSGGTGSTITATTASGAYGTTAFGINDSGMVCGVGVDPNNAARNVGFMYNSATGQAFEVGALAGRNGAICYNISSTGFVVGASMQNQGSSLAFVWSQAGGMVEIPLVTGASSASARGVNAAGWAVGTGSGAKAIPFLYIGGTTHRLVELIVAGGAGWDLVNNTTSSAMGISDDGTIVGTAVINGQTHAYVMTLVPAPASVAMFGLAGLLASKRRRG